jgi:CheY-like chemotaxis protein
MAFMRSRGTVLVVDDSAEVRKYFQTLLELNSYSVKSAGSGAEALGMIFEGLRPDVVLLDVNMPEMDGLTTLQHMRALYPELKVIVCSGESDPWYSHQALALGAEAFLVKPVRHLYLTAALERCLTVRRKLHPSIESTVIPFRATRTC